MNKSSMLTLMLCCGALLLEGCAVGVGAGAATGTAAAYDRRSTGAMVDDQIIEFKALDAIRKDQDLWNQIHFNATSVNNIVLLTGEAPRDELRQRAESLIKRIPKVRRVHNEIVIAAPSSMLSRSSDSWLTGKVKTMLIQAKQVAAAARIKVVTENGTVYLMGLVTRDEGDAATDVARKVSGVQRVVKIFEYVD